MSNKIPESASRRIISGTIIAGSSPVSGQLFFGTSGKDVVQPIEEKEQCNPEIEIKRVEAEISAVAAEIETMADMLSIEGFRDESDILNTHLMMLQDAGLKQRVVTRISEMNESAEKAVGHVFSEIRDMLSQSDNAIVKDHSSDIEDLRQRLKQRLSGVSRQARPVDVENLAESIVFFPDLLVSNIIEARNLNIVAIIVGSGTQFSHAAIIAKSFGITVIRVDGIEVLDAAEGAFCFVDVENSRLIINANEVEVERASKITVRENKPITNSCPLSIWLNLIDLDIPVPRDIGEIAGIGLYRSEYLLTSRTNGFPSEEEQVEAYNDLFRSWNGLPVTVRTFDIGGDKILPFMSLGPQDNPNLGLRAHRLYRFHPELFLNQIRAILRAGVSCPELRILYPMVETVDELNYLQGLLKQALDDLAQRRQIYQKNFKQGVLIEVPSAVWALEDILEKVDFISVGTNDLLQYHFAVDRGNANVGSYYVPENPSALRMLKYIADTADSCGKKVTICGEIAADPKMVPLLYGLGYTNFSIDIHSVQKIKNIISEDSRDYLTALAGQCLFASTKEEVHQIMNKFEGYTTDCWEQSTINDALTDPVCGMVVHAKDNLFTLEKNRKTYSFCSAECLRIFKSKPERYT